MKWFEYNNFAIIGGTGTLGQALTSEILKSKPEAKILILSRDEQKQALMKRKFPTCRFKIADVRDSSSISPHIYKTDVVFHVAAMKHVDVVEENITQSIQTNVHGTTGTAGACVNNGVKHMVFSSTDKAVDPINVYGYTKALSEKILFQYNTMKYPTKFSVYRWGNVLGSQGSVIPYFIKTLLTEAKANLTHPDMTRYWIPIDWAVGYMLFTFPDAKPFQAMIPPTMKSAKVIDVIDTLAEMLGVRVYDVHISGIRPGEKIHEAMYSSFDPNSPLKGITSENAERYSKDELKALLLPFVERANEFI